MSLILLNCFSGVLKLFRQNIFKNTSLLGLKSDNLRKWQRIIQKVIFSQCIWNGANPEKGFWFNGNDFVWSQQWNRINITEKIFAPLNEPQTAKLTFSCVLKHFQWKLAENFSFRSKVIISGEAKDYQESFFLNEFEMEQILWNDFDCRNQIFWFKTVKRDK